MYVQVHICMMYECLYVCMCVYVFIQVCILCICMYEVRTRMSRVRRHFCSRVDRSALPSRLSPAPRIPSPLNSLALSRLRASQVIDQRSLSLSLSLHLSLSLPISLSPHLSLSISLSLHSRGSGESDVCVCVDVDDKHKNTHLCLQTLRVFMHPACKYVCVYVFKCVCTMCKCMHVCTDA